MGNLELAMKKVAAALTENSETDVPGNLEDICLFIAEKYHGSAVQNQYKSGDTFSISADTAGFVTSSKKEFRTVLYTDKPLSSDITSASFVSGRANVIQDGSYIIGSSGNAVDLTNYTCEVTIRNASCLSISINSTSAFPNSSNNGAAGAVLRDLQIEFH